MVIFSCGKSAYLLFVQLPLIGQEMEKQREINDKLNDKINELKDVVKYSYRK